MEWAAAIKQCLRKPFIKSIIAHISQQIPEEANVILDKGWFIQYIDR